jgi:hypothetical protein
MKAPPPPGDPFRFVLFAVHFYICPTMQIMKNTKQIKKGFPKRERV